MDGRLRVEDVTAIGSQTTIGTAAAIHGLGRTRLDLTRVRVTGSPGLQCVVGVNVRMTDVDVSGTNAGVAALGRINATNLTANDTNNWGVSARRGTIVGLVAHGNRGPGVRGGRLRLVDSDVTGNGTGGDGIDISTTARPRLTNTACGRSEDADEPGTSWGVCLAD